MIELVDLGFALVPHPKSNWPRDVKRRLIYVHVRLAVNPVDNALMHDIYTDTKLQNYYSHFKATAAQTTDEINHIYYLAHKYSV